MRNRPLQWQLSMLIVVVLGLSLAVATWIGYRQIVDALVDNSAHRLVSVTRQLTGLFADAGARMAEDSRRVAANTAVVAFLERRDAARETAAIQYLDAERLRSSQTESVHLTDRTGRDVLVRGTSDARLESREVREGLSPLRQRSDGLAYSITRAVRSSSGDTLGFLVVDRRVGGQQGAEQLSSLIGTDAELLMGNSSGTGWYNLTHERTAPAVPIVDEPQVLTDSASGELFLTTAMPVNGTPWAMAVQFPHRTAIAPAHAFLQQVSLTALLVLAIGTTIAFVVVRKVMSPLRHVSNAARDLAAGDYARRVPIRSQNEVGQLAATFNGMAEQVEQTRFELQEHATALQETNEELRNSELRYRRFVEESPDAMIVHRGSRVLFANPAAAHLLGAQAAGELIGRTVDNLVDTTTAEISDAALNVTGEHRALRAPVSERQLTRLDGAPVYVDAASTPFTLDARPSTLTILRDVRERKDLEARYLQSQKMEVLGQLAGGVAHDFNNLLTIIGSYSSLLLADMPDDDERRGDLEEIINATSRAAALTRQLLAVSRKQVLQPDVLDINDIVGGVGKLLGRTMPSHISLRTFPRAESGCVFADPVQVEQILMNLCVNAIDAMPNGGVLTLETDVVEVREGDLAINDLEEPGIYVTVAVGDTGTGISQEARDRIFEPFFTTKAPGKGTGLGLATVRAIILQLQGQITLYSEPGMGTVFRLYMPLHREDRTRAVLSVPEPVLTHVGTETVLVAEDEGPVRNAVRRMLERAGYRVLEASSGAEALAVYSASHGIDVLLTDMMMPDMSGSRLAEQIRVSSPEIPVLFMSGYTAHSTFLQGFDSNRATFIQKPFTGAALLQRIREVLERAA